ncbi:HAMP domain-containing histidine kinase, partial [Candidatus Woesebacteria bacterium]|nr:HAMP domain-containing histidine kinase [Candidatus Woesebacteria bacterium]
LKQHNALFNISDVFRTATKEAYWVGLSVFPVLQNNDKDRIYQLSFLDAELSFHGKEDYVKARSKYKVIFDASHDWKLIVTDAGVVEEGNAAALKFFKNQMLGKMVFSLFSSEDRSNLKVIWDQRHHTQIRLVPFSFAHENGEEFHTELSIVSSVFPRKNLIIIRDITSKVAMQRQHDQFLAVASHELKTPLAVIKAFVQLLDSQVKELPNPKVHRYVHQIEEKTDLLTLLVSDVVDSIRLGSNKLKFSNETISFDETVKQIVDEIQAQTDSHELKLTGNTNAMVNMDPFRLRQVLHNLLTNAINSSVDKEQISITLVSRHQMAEVRVRDFGRGLSKKDQKDVFLPFFRNKALANTHGGTGLGLYLCQRIANHYKGKISVVSDYRKGSEFTVSLPTA